MKEAISSVIFASPRCEDIPELMDVRKHFTTKYGKEFVSTVIELRPECGVSQMVSLQTLWFLDDSKLQSSIQSANGLWFSVTDF